MNRYLTLSGVIILLLLISIKLHAQPGPEEAVKRLGPNPVFFIDSVKVTQADLQKYDPQSIASVTILKDSAMIKSCGGEVNQGVVLIETRNFARRRFVKFLKSVSAKYDSLIQLTEMIIPSAIFSTIKCKKEVMKEIYQG